MDKERLLPGTKERLPRMCAETAQDLGQGGGYIRQWHYDNCRGDDMSTMDFNSLEFEGFR
jgi:hypothetical protein